MSKWRLIWITDYVDKNGLQSKLGSKHGIDVEDFTAHTLTNKQLLGYEIEDSTHGIRTVIEFQLSNGKWARAYIDLVNSEFDIWSLRTARYLD